MPATAIDIGTYTIKAISGKAGAKVQVDKTVEFFNQTGIVIPADDAQMEQMIDVVTNMFTDHKLPTSDVRLALPESVVSTKLIQMPRLSDAELASAIGWQAEQYIPIPPEELTLEYRVVYRPAKDSNEQMRVLLVGAKKAIIDRFVTVFNYAGIEPKFLETQILSVIRSLQFEPTDSPTLIVHFGANSMVLAVVAEGDLSFVFNHMNGSQILTKALEQGIGLSAEQAEQYKREYGLDPAQFQGKVREALLPGVNSFIQAMQKAIRFYVNQNPTQSIERVLLSGGGAQLPGLAEEVTNQLGLEVLLAAPFANSEGNIPEGNHAAMSVCMGLMNRQL